MALEYIDGFEDYLGSQITRYYNAVYTASGSTVQTTTNNVTTVAGRYGGSAILTSSGAPGLAPSGGNQATRTVGMAVQLSGVITSNVALVTWVDAVNMQVSIVINANGTISAYRGSPFGTLLGTTTQGILSATWYYVEMTVTISPTVGVVTINVNGLNWLSLTGQNTRNSSNSFTNLLCFGSISGGGNIIVDDLYIRDDATMLGDQRVESIYPSGVGASSQFTKGGSTINAQNYQQVNEATPDDDTTYVFTGVGGVGNVDLYTYNALPTTAGAINGVMVCPMMKNDAGGLAQGEVVYRIGGVNFFGTPNNLNANYVGYPDLTTINPGTSNPWTIADVNAAQFGIKRTA